MFKLNYFIFIYLFYCCLVFILSFILIRYLFNYKNIIVWNLQIIITQFNFSFLFKNFISWNYYRFTLPDGQEFEMKYVADENGFQPQSSFLPVAPAFPHPIPDFVLKQIEKARLEDEAAEREASSSGSFRSDTYEAPPRNTVSNNGYGY